MVSLKGLRLITGVITLAVLSNISCTSRSPTSNDGFSLVGGNDNNNNDNGDNDNNNNGTGNPTVVIVSGNNQTVFTGATAANPLVVKVLSANGVGVGNQTVVFAINNGSGFGSVNGSNSVQVQTNSTGVAQVSFTAGAQQGQVNISATAAGYGVVNFVTTVSIQTITGQVLPLLTQMGCTTVTTTTSFEFDPFVPRSQPVVVLDCPSSLNISISPNETQMGLNKPFQVSTATAGRKKLVIRSGYFIPQDPMTKTYTVSITSPNGSGWNALNSTTNYTVKVNHRKVKKDEVVFENTGVCNSAPVCLSGTAANFNGTYSTVSTTVNAGPIPATTVSQTFNNVQKCKYDSTNYPTTTYVRYIPSGNISALFYAPVGNSQTPCPNGGTYVLANSGYPNRCLIASGVSGRFYGYTAPDGTKNFYRDVSNTGAGNMRATCPYGSIPTYVQTLNLVACELWNLNNITGWPNSHVFTYPNASAGLYQTPRSTSPICPEGSNPDGAGNCHIANMDNAWTISLAPNSGTKKRAIVIGKNLQCH